MNRDDAKSGEAPQVTGPESQAILSRSGDDGTEQLFADALAWPEMERTAFLDRACKGDVVRRLESAVDAAEKLPLRSSIRARQC